MSSPMPFATHEGELGFDDGAVACAVLNDGRSILSQSQALSYLGMEKSGSRTGEVGLSILALKRLKPLVDKHLVGVKLEPIPYRTLSGRKGLGIDADTFAIAVTIWSEAWALGLLRADQEPVARRAHTITLSLARLGIHALIHEATGYQEVRDQAALRSLFKGLLSEKLQPWTRRFPEPFWRGMSRLLGTPYLADFSYPPMVGKFIKNYVYRRLAPTVIDQLEERNPADDKGQRKTKHHQHLSNEGVIRLQEHLGIVQGLMQVCDDLPTFKRHLDQIAPVYMAAPLFEAKA